MSQANSLPAATAAAPGRIPLIDVQRQHAALAAELRSAIERVCASGRFVLGPECDELERALAEYCQAPHAIACASGSDALLLPLLALEIGPGDEVIVPAYTFFATASAVARLGARPVFVDIDASTYNIDPASVRRAITPATRAIIPVHLYGQCAEMDAIRGLAATRGLAVIEDAAQAIGAEYRGRRTGALGDMACFSFYPTKNLGGAGDGGLVTTTSGELNEKLRLLRVHGMQPRYHHRVIGINSRLDTLQAAILLVKLAHLETWNRRRAALAGRYRALMSACSLDRRIQLPESPAEGRHVWNQFVIRDLEGRRDELRSHLADRGIGTEIYYPIPLHLQSCFAYLKYASGSLPVAERAAHETLALPIFPELTDAEQERVVDEINAFYRGTTPRATTPAPHFLPLPTAGVPSPTA